MKAANDQDEDGADGHRFRLLGLAFLDDLAYRCEYGPALDERELEDLEVIVKGVGQALEDLRAEAE